MESRGLVTRVGGGLEPFADGGDVGLEVVEVGQHPLQLDPLGPHRMHAGGGLAASGAGGVGGATVTTRRRTCRAPTPSWGGVVCGTDTVSHEFSPAQPGARRVTWPDRFDDEVVCQAPLSQTWVAFARGGHRMRGKPWSLTFVVFAVAGRWVP